MAISHQTTSAFYFSYAGGDSGRAYCCNAVPFRFGYSVRRRRLVVVSRRRLLATDLRVGVAETTAADRNDAAASSSVVVPSIEIPVTCYQSILFNLSKDDMDSRHQGNEIVLTDAVNLCYGVLWAVDL
nr:plastid division protein CDP1, chloroplastic [Ipomoea trifida]